MRKLKIVLISLALLTAVLGICGCGLFSPTEKPTCSIELTAPAGGKITLAVGSDVYTVDSGTTEELTFAEDTILYISAIANDGFEFNHWEIGEAEIDNNSFHYSLEENLTLKAVFTDLRKTITVVDEQDNLIKTFLCHGNGLYQKLQTEVTASGYYYTFSIDGEPLSQQTSIQITQDLTVVATKHLHSYSISYKLNGGAITAANQSTYNVESQPITLNNPTKEHYTFEGWTGTGLDVKTETVTIPTGSTGDRSYAATWSPIDFAISYDLDGGTLDEANPTTYNVESDTITLKRPVKEHYVFAGWTGTGLNRASKDVSIYSGSNGERSYTATWTPIDYSLYCYLNGGTSDEANPTTYNIESDTITLINPAKPGYSFAGWTGTGLDAKTETVTIPTGSSGNKQYIANWNLIEYTLSFKEGGNTVKTEIYTAETSKPQIADQEGYYIEWKVGETAWDDYDIFAAGDVNVEITVTKQVAYKVTLKDWDNKEFGKNFKKFNYDEETKTTTFVYVDGDAPITLQAKDTHPTRKDFYFLYWSTGENKHTSTSTIIDTSIKSDQTFTAVWYKEVQVTYDGYSDPNLPTRIYLATDNKIYEQTLYTQANIKLRYTLWEYTDVFPLNSINLFSASNSDGSNSYVRNILDNRELPGYLMILLKPDFEFSRDIKLTLRIG